MNLKALAQQVLERDRQRDSERDSAGRNAVLSRPLSRLNINPGENKSRTEAWAEALARLDPNAPPADVPPRCWRRFLDDAGRFLDDGWGERAKVLGWEALDLFGCDRARPYARVDRAGLLWLLDGGRVVLLTDGEALVETPTGARQRYRRVHNRTGLTLVWELRG